MAQFYPGNRMLGILRRATSYRVSDPDPVCKSYNTQSNKTHCDKLSRDNLSH